MIQIDIKNFISKARALIAKDKRTSLERGARKRPKIDFLNSISETVILLLDNLFSVSDQVFLINSIDKRFCVSDTTYSKFLSENLTNEYARFRKNRIFASKVRKIKDAIALYPVSPKIQFSAIFGDEESVSFEDYEFFIENYYLKSEKEFLESDPVKIPYVPWKFFSIIWLWRIFAVINQIPLGTGLRLHKNIFSIKRIHIFFCLIYHKNRFI